MELRRWCAASVCATERVDGGVSDFGGRLDGASVNFGSAVFFAGNFRMSAPPSSLFDFVSLRDADTAMATRSGSSLSPRERLDESGRDAEGATNPN
jgi:hypothetical protein